MPPGHAPQFETAPGDARHGRRDVATEKSGCAGALPATRERRGAYRRGHVGLAARGLIGYADFLR